MALLPHLLQGLTEGHHLMLTCLPRFSTNSSGRVALVLAVAALQEAPSASIIRGTQVKQAESTSDQLCNRPLEEIPTHRNHTIIVTMFTRNTQSQNKKGLPPGTPFMNLLIMEQSRETRAFGTIPVTRHQVESIINTRATIMTSNTRTAANSQQDIMIQSAETA